MVNCRDELFEEMFANMSRMKRLMASCLRSEGKEQLPPSQTEVLLLVGQEQPVPLKQLAERMRLTPGAISQLVEGVERLGLIKRELSQQDRRVVNITCTNSGKRKVAAVRHMHRELMLDIVEALDNTELEAMVRMQQKMVAHMQAKYHPKN